MVICCLQLESCTSLKIRIVIKGQSRLGLLVCVYVLLSLCACGRFSTPAPSITRHDISIESFEFKDLSKFTARIGNLVPSEETILIDGKTIPISVDIKIFGDSHYCLIFSTNEEEFRPFIIKTMVGVGDIEFSGTATWFLDVHGINETVQMSLYHIDQSESGKTEVKTLVSQIKRKYQIVCDEKEFFIVLMLKRFFGLCICEKNLNYN